MKEENIRAWVTGIILFILWLWCAKWLFLFSTVIIAIVAALLLPNLKGGLTWIARKTGLA